MKPLSIAPVRTALYQATQPLAEFVVESVPGAMIHEGMILAVTSKIVSIAERRIVAKASIEKSALIIREADHNLGAIGYGSILTIKESMLIASAGIDESNSESGDYILYPEKPFESAEKLYGKLRSIWKIENLGIVFTDSKTSPLRLGVTGISLAYWGFKGLEDKVGSQDLFGRTMQMTKVNFADGLASAATLVMGEGNESIPLAVISGAAVDFTATVHSGELRVPVEDDLYYPLFKPLIR